MTVSESIEKLKNMRLFMQITDENSEHKFPQDYYKANEMAMQALEEVQQYRAIGTPEECRAAVGKQKVDKELESHDEKHILKVTDVRVERLQEITEEQIGREGVEVEYPHVLNGEEKRYAFSTLWNSTVKKSDLDRYGWNANPWVWVIEFERCEKPEE